MREDKAKYERCVLAVKARTGYKESAKKPKVNPWAVCHASLKKASKKASKKAYMKRSKKAYMKRSKKASKKAYMKRSKKC